MSSVLRSVLSAVLAVVLALMFLTSGLADLRSPAGAERAGAALAEDPTVQRVVVDLTTDAALDTLATGPLPLGPLLPLLRSLITNVLMQFLATETGQTILAGALADVVQQASFGPPLILDLRPALAAALEIAPAPLLNVADVLLFDDTTGLLLLDADGVRSGAATEVAALRASRSTNTVGALSHRIMPALLGAVALILVVLLLARRDERVRPGAPAGIVLAVSFPVALTLAFAAGALTRALARLILLPFTGPDEAASELTDVLVPLVATQFADLLGPTRLLATSLAAASLLWLAFVHLRGRIGD